MQLNRKNFFNQLTSLVDSDSKILLGFSGGSDSTALLILLCKVLAKENLHAIHINHNLNDYSLKFERFSRKFCSDNNVSLTVIEESRNIITSESDEMWGRRIRYKHFQSLVNDLGFDFIATAHHANDNFETVLMNLDNGCSINGIRGIPERNKNIIRPLLRFKKKDILKYMHQSSINYIDDPSNEDISIKRNFIRKNIMTKIEALDDKYIDKLSLISMEATLAVNKLHSIIKQYIEQRIDIKSDKIILSDFSIKSFSNYQKLILIKHIVGEGNIPWRKHRYESLKNLFHKPKTGSLFRINKNWSILRDRYSWVIYKSFKEEVLERLNGEGNYGFKEFNLSLRKIKYLNNRSNNQTEVIDFETIKNKSLLVRSWKKGDRFSPLGMKGSKKLSDYFIDKKLNNYEKKRQLVLTADDEIIWLCGDRISDKVKITNKTSEMLELSYHR